MTNRKLIKMLEIAAVDSVAGNLELAEMTLYWIAAQRIKGLTKHQQEPDYEPE